MQVNKIDGCPILFSLLMRSEVLFPDELTLNRLRSDEVPRDSGRIRKRAVSLWAWHAEQCDERLGKRRSISGVLDLSDYLDKNATQSTIQRDPNGRTGTGLSCIRSPVLLVHLLRQIECNKHLPHFQLIRS